MFIANFSEESIDNEECLTARTLSSERTLSVKSAIIVADRIFYLQIVYFMCNNIHIFVAHSLFYMQTHVFKSQIVFFISIRNIS
jgi:hypothetical protein